METTQQKVASKLRARLEDLSEKERAAVDLAYTKTASFERPDTIRNASFEPCTVGFEWSRDRQTVPEDRRESTADLTWPAELPAECSLGTNVWFRVRAAVPDSMAGCPVSLQFVVLPLGERNRGAPWERSRTEALCYRDGEVWQAFDGGRDDLLLTECAEGGETFDLLVEVGTTNLWGDIHIEDYRLETAELVARREAVEECYHTVSVFDDLWRNLDADSINRSKILRSLSEAWEVVDFQADDEARIAESASEARALLLDRARDWRSELSGTTLSTLGHAHLDLAWLWPWTETVRKAARTGANALQLMDEYDEFRYLQSQPHHYEFLRARWPTLTDRMESAIDDGRWLPTGALWVEADVNIAGGEALARQFCYGKRYFREHYDTDPQIAYIPDVFGYTAALPGIASEADCDYFLTQKMSWNEVNEFPHATFHWEGIDGSSLLSHFPPANTYNGRMTMDQVRGSFTGNPQADQTDRAAYLIGWGDGGGGANREMMERSRVIDEIGSLPDIDFESLTTFFETIAGEADDLPRWSGELYLEKHRGTLTTQAQTKRNNRKGEIALREAEYWAALAATVSDQEYPIDSLTRAWKILLFNQFHDVLPGSSIREVYVDADRDYERVFEAADTALAAADAALFTPVDSSNTFCVTNSLPWERTTTVRLPADAVNATVTASETSEGTPAAGDTGLLARSEHCVAPIQRTADGDLVTTVSNVPSMGATTVSIDTDGSTSVGDGSPLEISGDRLANEYLAVTLDERGRLADVTDREVGRSVLAEPGNDMRLYRDLPEQFRAWDIDGDIYDVSEPLPEPEEVTILEDGPIRAVLRQVYEFGESRLAQDTILEAGTREIRFETRVDWHEEETLLKTHFPIDVQTSDATFDIQFGHVERATHDNTTWEAAQFEGANHHWVDVCDSARGAAVLNDCKYGVNVDGSDIGLSLLRAPTDPDPEADRGHHEFSYALRPHEGSLQTAGIIEAGYEFNIPARAFPVEDPVSFEGPTVDAEGVVIESVKRAEDEPNSLIFRCYEAYGRSVEARLEPGVPIEGAASVSIVEDERTTHFVHDRGIDISLDAFEIETIRVDVGVS